MFGKNLIADSAVNIFSKNGNASINRVGRFVKNEILSVTIGGRIKANTKISHATVEANTKKDAAVRGIPRFVSLFTTGLSALMNMNAKKRVKMSSFTIHNACNPMRKTTVNTIVFQDISMR